MSDVYQSRYEKHQAKKREQLISIFEERRSQRNYNGKEIPQEKIDDILEICANAPSSCNRQAVYVIVVSLREDKDFLSGILVGGVGWVHRADKILLLFAKKEAYKAPGEIHFMPYLDAGVQIAYIQLAGETHGIGMAYVNPNIREKHKSIFQSLYGDDIYCGAISCGYYDTKAEKTPKKKSLKTL
jgi:nitroreductase